MKIHKYLALGAVTAMAAIAPTANAADAEVKAKVDLPDKTETRTELKHDRDVTIRTDADTTASRDKVKASNKASGLLGMEVRNQNNEKLGEIKDLVLDVKSGKISYAVLAVGGFLGIGEKLVALPPRVLQVADDQSHLTINADKSRIQAAPGFAATSWPNVNDPEINTFWRSEASGSAAGSEIRRSEKSGIDADVDVDRDRKQLKSKIEVDHDKDKIYTDADDDKKVDIKVKKD
jgi:sporulation protein YlmC with PRC-barrel domain